MTDLDRLADKLEKMVDRQNEMNVILARLTSSVEEHVRRSNLLEAEIAIGRSEMIPLKQHVDFMNAAAQTITLTAKILVVIVSASWAIFKFLPRN